MIRLIAALKEAELVYGMIGAFMVAYATPVISLLFLLGALMEEEDPLSKFTRSEFVGFLTLTSVVSGFVAYRTTQLLKGTLEETELDAEMRRSAGLPGAVVDKDQLSPEWGGPEGQQWDEFGEQVVDKDQISSEWGVRIGNRAARTRLMIVFPMIIPWMALYVVAGLAAHFADRWVMIVHSEPRTLAARAFSLFIFLGFSVGMQAYLMLIVGALTRSTAFVHLVWKWRYAFDVLFVVVMFAATELQ